jgi:peptide/nickel transport system substrate-binding protein
MTLLQKNIRYFYWFIVSFTKKNIKLLILSFAISFFSILLLINFFPYFKAIFFKKKEKVGIIGKYDLQNLPDEISILLSNPLLTVSNKGEIIPVLIKSWEVSSDGKNYRLHLKPNLFWSDGKIFSAYDIDYQFKDVSIKVLDNYTVDFNLNQPLSIFPMYLTKPIIKYPLKGLGGLYQVESYKLKNGYLSTLYLLPGREDLSYKTYKFYDTEDKLIVAYKKGEINIINTYKQNIADLFSHWKNTTVKKTVDYSQILTLFLNTKTVVLSTKEARKSLAYALPYFNKLGEQANGPISPLSWAHVSDLKKYLFDEEKAITLFKKTISSSDSAQLNFYTFYDYMEAAEAIKENFEKIGLKTNLQILSYLPQKFDLLLTMWSPQADPDQYYFWHSSQEKGNITGYKNLKVDKLLEDGRKIINVEDRKKIYAQFQEIIMDDLPAFFLYYPYVYRIERR